MNADFRPVVAVLVREKFRHTHRVFVNVERADLLGDLLHLSEVALLAKDLGQPW